MSENLEEKDLVLSVKPVFKFWYNMFPITLTTIAVFILVLYLGIQVKSIKLFFTFMVWYFVIVGVVTAVFMFFTRERFKRYLYKFYNDKLVYIDSFIDYSEKEIKYSNIIETTINQTLLQRFFDIGTITINTSAENGSKNGIYLYNIDNIRVKYGLIREILKK